MQSAIRSGDYKLYKNHVKGNYELYRLYKNGKRADLEERFDIAAKSPKIVKDLSTKLEKYLKDYNAKFPYKDPSKTKEASEKQNIAAIPVVVTDIFDAKTNKLSVTLEKGKSNVIESYVLIKIGDPATVDKNGRVRKRSKHGATYIEIPVESNKNGLEYTATIPKDALECVIVLIDENRYMVEGKLHQLEESKSPVKKNKNKKKKIRRTN
jgi:hypothetical protein